MSSHIEISGLVFEIRRGPHRRSLGLTVDRHGELVVHVPEATLEAEVRSWVTSKLLWIHQKLVKKNEMGRDVYPPEFVSGETIFYLGRSYRLRLVDDAPEPLRFDGQWFELRRSAKLKAAEYFQRWFVGEGDAWLRSRSVELERFSGQTPSKVIVRDLGYRWGSCGKNRALYFNWRLLQLPVHVIDYVVLHEQVHLLHHNHSSQFWKTMDSVLPDWRARKEELDQDWMRFARFALVGPPSRTVLGPVKSGS